MADEIPSSSSGEEYIDLDLELSTSESDCSPPLSPQKRKEIFCTSLKQIEEEEDDDNASFQAEDDGLVNYKILGQPKKQPTKNNKTISASWVSNAIKFSSEIVENDNLSQLETMHVLKPEFLPILQRFTKVWFPVQKAVLPILLNELGTFFPPRDLVICSPTGSGKTLCYVLPILNKLTAMDASAVFALIIAPNLNLGQQILMEFEKFNVFGAKIVSLIGDNEHDAERTTLFPNSSDISEAQIIVATPGRLVEHLLDEYGFLNLTMLRYLVVDEADRMQDTARMEWLELVEKHANVSNSNLLNLASISDATKNRWLQRILVSATLSLDVHKLHIWNLRCPRLFQPSSKKEKREEEQPFDLPEGKDDGQMIALPSSLTHHLIQCKPSIKPYHLFQQIHQNYSQWNRVIVFVNKRDTGNRLAFLLSKLSDERISAAEYSSNLFRKRRLKLLKDFQRGKIKVLIACDILSRGIDVVDVDCVINYEMPINERIFAHRAGRTARGLNSGILLTLATKQEKMRIKKLLTPQKLWGAVKIIRNEDGEELDEEAMERYKNALSHLKKKNTAAHRNPE